MYAGSLKSTRYLLLTEFKGRSACYGLSFFAWIYGPSTKRVGAINRVEKTRLILIVSTYVINQKKFLRSLHLALKRDVRWTKSVQSG